MWKDMSLIRCCPSGRYRRRRSESEAVKDYRCATRVLKGAYSFVSCIAVGSLCSTGHVRNRSGRDPTTSSVSRPSSARGRRRRVMSVSSASELQTNKGGMPWFRLSTPRVLNCPPWSFGLELQIDVAKCGLQSRVLHYSGSGTAHRYSDLTTRPSSIAIQAPKFSMLARRRAVALLTCA